MFEVIIGAGLGITASIAIAEAYHRRAARQFDEQIAVLSEINESFQTYMVEIKSALRNLGRESAVIRKHAAAGTLDDPNYPYK